MQNLQQQLDMKTVEHDKLVTLLEMLRYSTDYDATTLFARLQLSASVDELIGFCTLNPGSTTR